MKLNHAALAWRNVRSRRARSWLTIVGILIGVMAVITLISVGTGVENAVLGQFKNIGLDIILLTPGTGLAQAGTPSRRTDGSEGGFDPIDQDGQSHLGSQPDGIDVDRLRSEVPEIVDMGRIGTHVLPVSAGELGGYIRVLTPCHELMARFQALLGGFAVREGRMPRPGASDELLLGAAIARQTNVGVGETVRVGGSEFTVVGILAPSSDVHEVLGGDLVSGESAELLRALANLDNAMFVPYEAAAPLWGEQPMSTVVAMRIRTGVSVTETIEKINRALVQQGAFMTPISTQALADNVQKTLGMVRTVLASIAAISLLVGAVGMMNTMYTAVLERRREIGVLKSIGARDRQVLAIFLVDSGLMGLVGGMLGVLVGVGVSLVGTSLFGRLLGVTTFSPYFAPWLIVSALLASFLLGALAGVWPAWHASKLDPVRALRST